VSFYAITDKALGFILRVLAYPLLWLRRFSYWLATRTKYDYCVMRKRGTLRYRISGYVRTPFTRSGNVFAWSGRDCDASLSIPGEIGEQEARMLLLAQHIHPRFAEELMERAGSDAVLRSNQ